MKISSSLPIYQNTSSLEDANSSKKSDISALNQNSISFAGEMEKAEKNSSAVQTQCETFTKVSPKDIYYTGQLVTTGLIYRNDGAQAKKEITNNPPLQDAPRVNISRPYIMVPGWTTKPDKFDALVEKLTDGGKNGGQAYYVQNGQFFADGELTKKVDTLPKDAKVFVAVFESNHQDPSLTAPQLSRSLAAIRNATNSEKVDVEGYSMGGLCTRNFLDKDGAGVGKVMLLGTPNHGARFADLSKHVIKRDIKFAMNLAGVAPVDLPAFEWLSTGDNPKLKSLNSRFDKQKSKTEKMMVVGGKSNITPSFGIKPVARGDGMVTVRSLVIKDLPTKILDGRKTLHHSTLPVDREVYDIRADFFDWEVEK